MKVDFAQAIRLFLLAAEQNFNEAQFNLGVMYAKGEGVQEDIGKAYAWFDVARQNGNTRAEEVVKNIERGLKPADVATAKQLSADLKKELDARVKKLVEAATKK